MSDQQKSSPITFADLLAQREWSSYEDFVSEAPGFYEKELGEDLVREDNIRRTIREKVLPQGFSVRRYENRLAEAEKHLFSGKVVAIDGTVSKFKTLSGLRCQIGVIAVNYFNDVVRKAYFISEASLRDEEEDILEVVKSREQRNRLVSDMVVRALMLYRERQVAMRPEYRDCFSSSKERCRLGKQIK